MTQTKSTGIQKISLHKDEVSKPTFNSLIFLSICTHILQKSMSSLGDFKSKINNLKKLNVCDIYVILSIFYLKALFSICEIRVLNMMSYYSFVKSFEVV